MLLAKIDPLGRSTVTAGSDHYFRTWCLYVRLSVPTFQNLAKTKQLSSENDDRYWRDCESGRVIN